MSYTVNTLATLSGVSIRTLRYYDEIGLLKPAYVGENNYRYYQEEQLLVLQQILFFKELGFGLKQIQDILKRTDFDKLKALQAHAKVIQKRIERFNKLSETITKTINHLEGKQKMNEKEMYYGFSEEQQKEYEKYVFDAYGDTAVKLMAESKENTKHWKQKDWDAYKTKSERIYSDLAQALQDGLPVESSEVQQLVQQHYNLIKHFYAPTKNVYIGLGQLYVSHPDFRALYEAYHAELPEFLADAMKVYADKNM